ncbi:MAG: helix-turn-helix domain-containing protein [Cyclobacteriaceae bacterium]
MKEIYLQGLDLDEFQAVIRKIVNEEVSRIERSLEVKQEYLTRKEAAELLSISLPTLHDWCKKKILISYRIGNRVYFKREELGKCMKRI